ncbi:MAG: aminotransferase class I/II-fold pyridoxal phosphate-dependent enzyme [bacterium]
MKKPSLLYYFAKAKRLQAEGKDVLGFTLTSPEFSPPPWLKEEVQKIYEKSFPYLPSGGDFELRRKLADHYSQKWTTKFEEKNLFVGAGGKEVLYVLLSLLLKKGGEVVVFSPHWATYPKVVDILHGKTKYVVGSEKDGFYPSVDKLKKVITAKTRVVILNSPNNPTGRIAKEEDVKALAELALKKNFILICDEVYENYDYENVYVSALKHFNKNVFCVFSSSKSFSLCGWRVGWGVGDSNIIQDMINVQSEISTSPNSLSQLALKSVFDSPQRLSDYLAETRAMAKERRDLAVAFLKEKNINFIYPEGCIAIFIKIPQKYKDSFAFTDDLLEKDLVSVAPGSIFGVKNYFRMNLSVSIDYLKKGLERIAKYYEN